MCRAVKARVLPLIAAMLLQVIGDWVKQHTLAEVLAAMAEARVPSGDCPPPPLI